MNSAIEYFVKHLTARNWKLAAEAARALPEENIHRIAFYEKPKTPTYPHGLASIGVITKLDGKFETIILPLNQPNVIMLISAVKIVLDEYAEVRRQDAIEEEYLRENDPSYGSYDTPPNIAALQVQVIHNLITGSAGDAKHIGTGSLTQEIADDFETNP